MIEIATSVFIEKAERAEQIARELFSNPIIYQQCALKGGTAINLLYKDKPRLSLDIDMNYIICNTREEMLQDREILREIIKTKIEDLGYIYGTKRNKFGQDACTAAYSTIKGSKENIKIELNYILRNTLDNSMQLPNTNIHALNPHELYASKITALLSRTKSRDLFDVYYLITQEEIELDLVKLRTFIAFYLAITKTYEWNISSINNISLLEHNSELHPCLLDIKPSLNEMKQVVISQIDRYLQFTKNETDFINNHKKGLNSVYELLGKNFEHPALNNLQRINTPNQFRADIF